MKIGLASDHRGYKLKEALIKERGESEIFNILTE